VVVENQQGRIRCSFLNIEQGIETALPAVEGNLIPLAPLPDGAWLGFYYNARQPGDIVHFERENPQPEKFASLTRVWERTSLNREQLAPVTDFRWNSADGMSIHGWLYRPHGKVRGAVVYVHGGPTYHSPDYLNAEIQFLVSQGFIVFDPNYRGSTGYGLPFQKAILADGWGGREQEDIRTGIEALIQAGVAQPGKIGITGTSYGGYSSWWAITHFPTEIVAASAPICGMTDLIVDYETTRPDLRPYSAEMMGGTPEQVPQRFYERSPLHFVQNIKGKLLIVQGGQDPNVTPQNVETVVKALNQHGIAYEVLNFEDEGHGIYKVKNQRKLYLRLAEFFESAFAI
jgi:dipeptidyl aminopeptidase/acylaminoacyl peptidase